MPVRLEVEVRFGPSKAHSFHIGCRPPTPTDLLERAVAAARERRYSGARRGRDARLALESADRSTTRLAENQMELIEQVCATNPRTVVVLNARARGGHAVDGARGGGDVHVVPRAGVRASAGRGTQRRSRTRWATARHLCSERGRLRSIRPHTRQPRSGLRIRASHRLPTLPERRHSTAVCLRPRTRIRRFAIEDLAAERTSDSGARVAVTVRNTF